MDECRKLAKGLEAKIPISEITKLTQALHTHARANTETQRLLTIPGVGPVTAMAITAFAPAMETFERERNFSAWLGLVPKQHLTGGRQILRRTSTMGQKDIRRLLAIGAVLVIKATLKKGRARTFLARSSTRGKVENGRWRGIGQQNGVHGLGRIDQ